MKIFLSYAYEESELAKEIALALRAENHTVFFDHSSLTPGEAYNAKIREAIEKSQLFVFLISPHSVIEGRYTLTELGFAEYKWPRPWGYVLSVIVMPTSKTDIPPYLRAATVLQPKGNVAAEIAALISGGTKIAWLRRIIQRYRAQLLVLVVLTIVGAGAGWWYHKHRLLLNLFNAAKIQQDTGHLDNAWKLLEQARSLAPDNSEVDKNVAKLGMVWLENASYIEGKGSFSAIVDKVFLPALSRCSVSSDKVYAADCLAHMGWGDFLMSRESGGLKQEEFYQRALALDPENVYAHAMWGHWLIANGNHLTKAKQHFAVALKSGREHKFVRNLQLAALQWIGTDENSVELIRVCNEMRKENDLLSEEARSRILSRVYFGDRDTVLEKLDQALPADEHLATFEWLMQGTNSIKSNYQTFTLARLLEAAGDCGAAQRLYVSLGGTTLFNKSREGLKRCRHKFPQLKSEVELLTELLHDKSELVRRQAVEGFSAIAADGASIDAKAIIPALRDAAPEVRAAAIAALARLGRQAIAPMIELLGSPEPEDQARAVRVLANMGSEAKTAVSALVGILDVPDNGVQEVILEALANIGPDASAAVAPIIKMLGAKPSLDMRKVLIYTLGEIGSASKPAVQVITEALSDQSDREGFLNVNAAEALGKIGPGAASAVPALIAALKSYDVRLPTSAATALGSIGAGAKAAIPALVEAMEREEQEHKKNQAGAIGQIAQALAIRKDRSSLKSLRAALRAEENANLDLATISPLREAIGFLEAKGP